jgi:hypothetical protein
MIVKKYVVYSLNNAIEGIGNKGLEYNANSFVLYFMKSFDNVEDAEKYIMDKMQDYRNRNIDSDTRFVIKTTYVYEGDEIF